MSTSYSRTCCSSAAASFGPSVYGTETKFSMPIVSSTWPPKRSATTPVRMPLRAAYTAAVAPAGPPPTTSTSNGSLASIFAASRSALPASSLATICSRLIRPESNSSPLTNTVGTAITWRASTSAWNSAPSMAVCLIRGLSTLIRFSACTTSGQFWQVSEK